MPNIIRIRNLDKETNITGGLIFPVDYSGDTLNQGYTSNIKRIDLAQIKDFVLFDYTGSTSGTDGTSGVDGSSGVHGSNGSSGISPCHAYQSNTIIISYSSVSQTPYIITTIPKIESLPISTTIPFNSGICYIVSGTTGVTFFVTGLTGLTDYSYEWYLNDKLVNLGNIYILSYPNDNDKIYLKQINCTNVNNIMVAEYCADCNSGVTGTFRYRTDSYNSYLEICMKSGVGNYIWYPIVSNSWATTTTTTTFLIVNPPILINAYIQNGDIMIAYSGVSINTPTMKIWISYDDNVTGYLIDIDPLTPIVNIGQQTNFLRQMMWFWASVPNSLSSNIITFDNSIPVTTTTTTTNATTTTTTTTNTPTTTTTTTVFSSIMYYCVKNSGANNYTDAYNLFDVGSAVPVYVSSMTNGNQVYDDSELTILAFDISYSNKYIALTSSLSDNPTIWILLFENSDITTHGIYQF